MAKAGPVERRLPPEAVETDPALLRWGVVSTIKAPLPDIMRFAAWHLEAGAARITIYLDAPNDHVATTLSEHPQIEVIRCDDAYWQGKPRKARETHQLRQAFNASRSYRMANGLHWLAHLDVDEFLLCPTSLAAQLAAAPPDCAFVRLSPVEMLSGPDGDTAFFKRTPKAAGRNPGVLETLFPNFGPHLPQGFVSYTGGKNIVRTGLGRLRLGIHSTKDQGAKLTNGARIDAVIGHAHAPDLETFLRHMEFRLTRGSYRNLPNGNRALHGILQLLAAEEGSDGIRLFYEEVCCARPELLRGLRDAGMLVEHKMDHEALVAKHFGGLAEGRS